MKGSWKWMTWRTLGCELRIVANMNNFGSWTQGSKCYEQLIIMDDMNNSISQYLRPPDAMNSSGLRIISMILGREPMSLNAMNNPGLWMKLKTLSHEVRALDAIKSSNLWMTWITLGRRLKASNAMNNLELWFTWITLSHELKALDAMNYIGLWKICSTPTCDFRAMDFINNSTLWMIRTTCDPLSSILYMLCVAQGCGLDERFYIIS